MNVIGISPQTTKAVLKRILKAYAYNWEYIEDENYGLLADSIFESDVSKDKKLKRKKDDEDGDDRDGKNNSGRAVSNRKRPGKEVVPSSDGIASIQDESPKDDQIFLQLRGKVNVSSNGSSAKHDSKDFHMTSEDVGVNQHFAKKGPEQKIIPKQEDSLRSNQRVGENNGNGRSKKKLKPTVSESPSGTSNSLAVVQQPHAVPEDVKRQVNTRDITNGQERFRIPLVISDDVSCDFPSFHYIWQNVIYQKASVPISLARIGDENCCSDCLGNCLNASIPCACARETGGEYAYTSEGLLKLSFLDSYVSKYRNTQKHHLHFCQICPLERIKNEAMPGRCRGHLIGTFIKECWTKCGCSLQCGNRVVQRGIRCHLEGWGLRSTKELPRGSFVCEYAGEILTNMELYERTMCATGNEKHTYPVMLDADWASEGILNDEEALCLDATKYGNVARFMNHRCCDGNVVEIPVEIETPDHHYYHVAFFTTRKVEPLEELCWDYGINFDDHNHPIKAFKCSCGSKLCRDKNRSKGK